MVRIDKIIDIEMNVSVPESMNGFTQFLKSLRDT